MPQQQSPFLEGKYGWNFGEGGWNTGMDENLLKFSFMFDRNVDSITSSLPASVNGQAHYLTTDNRIYFAVGATYFSTPVPKWFTIVVRATGVTWQFNGTSLSQVESIAALTNRLDAVELTLTNLGTAAFEDISAFATSAELDVVEGQAQSYTDLLRQDFADSVIPSKGATLVGYKGRTVSTKLSDTISVKDFGAVGDGLIDDTAAIQAALSAHSSVYLPTGIYLVSSLTVSNNQQIAGEGQENTIIKHKSGTNSNGLYGNNVNNIRIASLTLDGNSANNLTGGMGLRIEGNSSNIKVEDVRATNWRFDGLVNVGTGSYFDVINCRIDSNLRDGVSNTTVTHSSVSGSRVVGNGRFGVVFGAGCNFSRLSNNIITGNSATDALGAGALAINCGDVTFNGNTVYGNTLGHGLQFNTISRGVMSANVSRNNGISGLDSYTSKYITISGNVSFSNAVRGIEIDSGAFYNTCVGNIVYRNGEVGISIYRTPNTSVIGNYSTENGVTGVAKYGIRLWDDANTLPSSDCRIIGNVCSDDRGAAATQTHGISLENTASQTTLIGNRLVPNVTGAVNLTSGSFSYSEGNQGFSVASTALTLQNSWVAYDPGWATPASYVDASGVVFVTGSMKSGTTTAGTVVATLPVGQRPAKIEGPFVTYSSAGFTTLHVLPSGNIVAQSTLNATLTALNGITFKAS